MSGTWLACDRRTREAAKQATSITTNAPIPPRTYSIISFLLEVEPLRGKEIVSLGIISVDN